jgi:predicted secreted protein
MKPIKFDLPLNGTKIATLEQLEENLTPEIIGHFHSGKLAKWLRARSLTEQAEVVDALIAANNEREVKLFKSLCEVFVSEVDENDAREAINDYKTSLPSQQNTVDEDAIKAEAKEEIEKIKLKYEEEMREIKAERQAFEDMVQATVLEAEAGLTKEFMQQQFTTLYFQLWMVFSLITLKAGELSDDDLIKIVKSIMDGVFANTSPDKFKKSEEFLKFKDLEMDEMFECCEIWLGLLETLPSFD